MMDSVETTQCVVDEVHNTTVMYFCSGEYDVMMWWCKCVWISIRVSYYMAIINANHLYGTIFLFKAERFSQTLVILGMKLLCCATLLWSHLKLIKSENFRGFWHSLDNDNIIFEDNRMKFYVISFHQEIIYFRSKPLIRKGTFCLYLTPWCLKTCI